MLELHSTVLLCLWVLGRLPAPLCWIRPGGVDIVHVLLGGSSAQVIMIMSLALLPTTTNVPLPCLSPRPGEVWRDQLPSHMCASR